MARGVAVYGTPGFDQDAGQLSDLLTDHEQLAEWLSKRGQTLRYDAESLAEVEASIDAWRGAEQIAPMLANEVGLFLGAVLVKTVDQATWHVWPSGQPVVRIPPRRDIDVVALVGQRVALGQPDLTKILKAVSGGE